MIILTPGGSALMPALISAKACSSGTGGRFPGHHHEAVLGGAERVDACRVEEGERGQ